MHKVHADITESNYYIYIAPLGFITDDVLLYLGSYEECLAYQQNWYTGCQVSLENQFTQEQINADNAVSLIA